MRSIYHYSINLNDLAIPYNTEWSDDGNWSFQNGLTGSSATNNLVLPNNKSQARVPFSFLHKW